MNQQANGSAKTGWKLRFASISAGQAVSLIGSSATQFALIWWLTTKSGSAMVLSIAGLMAFLPQMLLGPFAGVWVDRLKRKTVIIAADMFIALAAGVFALLFLRGDPPFWTAYLVLALRSLGSVFHTPAIQAAIPMLVPQDQLTRANSVGQFLQSGSFMLGPVLGAWLYSFCPLPVIMLLDVAGAVIASTSVAVVKIPDPPREKRETPNVWREMVEGMRALMSQKATLAVVIASALCMIFYMPSGSLYPLMTSNHFMGTERHAALVEFLFAAGMLASAGMLGLLGEAKNKIRMMYLGLFLTGGTMLLCGLLPSDMRYFWMFGALCALMGASGNVFSIPYTTHLQQTIPPESLGRVFSLIGSFMSLAMPIGLLLAGPFAERYGVAAWFLVGGAAVMGISAVAFSLYLAKKRQSAR